MATIIIRCVTHCIVQEFYPALWKSIKDFKIYNGWSNWKCSNSHSLSRAPGICALFCRRYWIPVVNFHDFEEELGTMNGSVAPGRNW